MREQSFRRLIAVLYALAAVLLAAAQLARALPRLHCEERSLSIADAEMDAIRTDYEVEWLGFETGDMLAQSHDPQLIWTVDDTVSGLSFCMRTSLPVKDLELYYTTAAGQEYLASNRLSPAKSDPDRGYYEFRLPKATYVYGLRLDPTSAAGSFMEITELTLNPAPDAAELWLPGVGSLLTAAAAPLLTALVLREAAGVLPRRNKETG